MSTKNRKFIKIASEDVEVYENCIEMLQAAGYFRIRIASLSPFDKIVGGLCWCISNANVDVDVGNLFFHEEPNLGQKAAISDQIVRSLRLMRCPIRLQSYQIMGLDLRVIYRVFQWLIKTVFETREENYQRINRFSNLLFLKNYILPTDQERIQKLIKGKPYLTSITGLYESRRRFKRKIMEKRGRVKKKRKFNWEHVQSVLLEYGKEFHVVKKGGKKKVKGGRAAEQRAKQEEKRIKSIKRKLEKFDELKLIASEKLNKIVLTDKGNISSLDTNFATFRDEIKRHIDPSQNEEIMHKMNTKKKMRQIQNLKQLLSTKKEEIQKLIAVIKKKQQDYLTVKSTNTKVSERINVFTEKLDSLGDEDKSVLEKLRSLIELNENLKKQEKLFRIQCKNQLAEFNETIQHLEENVKANLQSNKNLAYQKIERIKALCDKKYANLKKKLLKENKKEILIMRKIDEIPISSELKQFEKRFSELITLILNNDKETRKYYDTFNTHSRILEYTEKKFSLFNSILEKFSKSLKVNQKKYSAWVIESVKKSLEQVKKSKEIVEKKTSAQKTKMIDRDTNHSNLVQQKRDYFRTLKNFEDEIKRNEDLGEKFQRIKENIKIRVEERRKKEEELRKKRMEEEKKRKEEEEKKRLEEAAKEAEAQKLKAEEEVVGEGEETNEMEGEEEKDGEEDKEEEEEGEDDDDEEDEFDDGVRDEEDLDEETRDWDVDDEEIGELDLSDIEIDDEEETEKEEEVEEEEEDEDEKEAVGEDDEDQTEEEPKKDEEDEDDGELDLDDLGGDDDDDDEEIGELNLDDDDDDVDEEIGELDLDDL